MGQQQADALVLLAEAALHHDLDPGATGGRYQVVVHVDAAVLADADAPGESVLEGGGRVPAGTSQRLACDASRVVMRHDAEGRLLEVGARTRTIPPALRRALQHRDRGCRFPGCSVRFGQGHHIRHWAQGGPTTPSNLALLCRRHPRAVHEGGYQVERLPEGDLEFRRPNGSVIPDVPSPPRIPGDPVHAIRARNEAEHPGCTRTRPRRPGLASGWMSRTRWTSCTLWRCASVYGTPVRREAHSTLRLGIAEPEARLYPKDVAQAIQDDRQIASQDIRLLRAKVGDVGTLLPGKVQSQFDESEAQDSCLSFGGLDDHADLTICEALDPDFATFLAPQVGAGEGNHQQDRREHDWMTHNHHHQDRP